jgi:hypothetical protein
MLSPELLPSFAAIPVVLNKGRSCLREHAMHVCKAYICTQNRVRVPLVTDELQDIDENRLYSVARRNGEEREEKVGGWVARRTMTKDRSCRIHDIETEQVPPNERSLSIQFAFRYGVLLFENCQPRGRGPLPLPPRSEWQRHGNLFRRGRSSWERVTTTAH